MENKILILSMFITLFCVQNITAQKADVPHGTSLEAQEVRVSTTHNTTLVNGFRSNAANYEIVNINGRTNVIKINGKDCDWNVISYSLADYRNKMIRITFSADVMRMGTSGSFTWSINNEPDYPVAAQLHNTEQGIWHTMSNTVIINPISRDPSLYLSTWEINSADPSKTLYYFDNLRISIEVFTWDYTPASVLAAVGEAGSDNTRNLYVSAGKGSDSGNGTQARPFAKIAHAMHYVRPGDTVLVDSGTYHERIKIPTGAAGRPVTLTAMPGAEVIITPTVSITPQWRQHAPQGAARNVYVADLTGYAREIDKEFPQLFADRDSMVEARYPNMGPSMSTIMDYKRDVAQRGTNKNTVVASHNIPSDIAGARLVIWAGDTQAPGWFSSMSPVKSADGRTINLAKDLMGHNSWGNGDPYAPNPGNPFYVTGALSLLDAPGEYFFDKQTNQLYFYPPWNGTPETRALSMRHFNNIAINAENTSFVNIRNITVYGGSIYMKDCKNNTIENCRIKYAEHLYLNGMSWGSSGIMWEHGYKVTATTTGMTVTGSDNRISGSEFGPTAGNGINLGGDNNVFTNNIVHNTGYSGNYLSGIAVISSKNLEISRNTIINSSWSHINFRPLTAFERCVIRNNYFENNCIFSSDGGAFYTCESDGGGTELFNNFVVVGDKGDNGTMKKLRSGLYTDNRNQNYVVRHNIVIGGDFGLSMNLWSKGTKFHNNTVVGAHTGISFYGIPIDNADASTCSVTDNLLVRTTQDIGYWGTENGRQASYTGNFIRGTIPVTQNPEGRMQSSGNARGTVDAQYRPAGRTPDIGAIPRNGQMFPYGADWKLEKLKIKNGKHIRMVL